MKLQQSTAVTIIMGPFVDATDGVTAETALSPTVYLSKNGGAFATRNSASAIAHDRDGFYTVPLDATDTNTVGRLIAQVSVGATHAPVWHEFEVLPSSSFAAIISGTGNGIRADVQANQDKTGYSISGTITTLDALDTAQDTQHSTTQASIAALNDPTAAAVADAVWDEARAGHTTVGSFGESIQTAAVATSASIAALNDLSSADVQTALTSQGLTTTRAGYLDELGPTNIPADVDAILVDTAALDSRLTATRAGYLDNLSAGAVALQATVTALNDLSASEVENAVWDATMASHTTAGTTGEALDSAGGGATPSAIADAVWDEARSGHTSVGTFGEAIQTAAVATAASISALNDLSAADVASELATYDAATGTEAAAISSAIAALNDPTAAAIADAVWDEPYAGHTTAGTYGKLLDLLRKARYANEGTVAGTPTSSAFDTNRTDGDGAFDHQLLVFTSGTLLGYASPINTFVNANGRITLQEALPSAPSVSDEFVILPDHVHPIPDIQSGLATSAEITALNDLDSAAVQTAAAAALTAYDPATGAEVAAVASAVGALNDIDSAAVQTAVTTALSAYGAAQTGDAMTLTAGERTSIATAVNGQVIYWVVDGGASAANISFPSADYPSKVRRRGWINDEAAATAATYGAADGADSEDICIVITGSQVTGKPYASQWRELGTS